MADSSDSSQDSRTELASLKEQMAEMFRILKTLQSEKEKTATAGPQPHSGSGSPSLGDGTGQPHESHDTNARQPNANHQANGRYNHDGTQRTPLGSNTPNTEKEEEKWSSIEERLRAIEGTHCVDLKNAFEMCLVPDVVLPPKFKVPEFEKYNGTTCPKSHLHMYARKMSAYHGNDKLLIHCFQDSLVGVAMNWYIRLEKTQIRTFLDLSNAFIRQYKYNEDAAPDRTQLQSMCKKPSENFREYVQRSVTTNFNALIKVGEKIEGGIKSGKISDEGSGSNKKPTFMKKKEAETHFIDAEPKKFQSRNNNQNNQRAPSRFAQNHNQNQTQNQTTPNPPHLNNHLHQPRQGYTHYPRNNNYNQQEKRAPVFDPIPITYTELFAYLLGQGMITPVPGRVYENPGPWHNENVNCAYHSGAAGHLVEDCRAFKYRVQDLINAKRIDFRETRPNITGNPLPNHGNQGVNAILEESKVVITSKVDDIKMPMSFIFREMCRQGLAEVVVQESDSKDKNSCEMHGRAGHSLEDCKEFRLLLQKMMDLKLIAISGGSQCYGINVLEGHQNKVPVFVRTYEPVINPPGGVQTYFNQHQWEPFIRKMEPVIARGQSPFPYESDKAVPWVYKEEPMGNPSLVTNIAGSSRITRSGRIYVPPEIERGPSGATKDKNKEKVPEPTEEEVEVALPEGVSNEEACEFLRFIKQSEYKVVDQLNKTPARISLLSLLMSSEAHRNMLLKVLNQAHVNHDITTDRFGGIVNNIIADNYISFCDQELPPEGTGHVRPLHISVMCNDCVIGKVLLDNGSSLNVMTKQTFSRLPVDASCLRGSSMIVKGFDGSRRDVMGEMELPIKIGPCTFNILFHVMDINPTYSCLLGRPWIHSSGAIPSTLHQKVKFVVDGRLITVSGEEDVMVSQPFDTRYVEVTEEALETSFQGLEIADTTFMIEDAPKLNLCPSDASIVVTNMMIREGYQPGRGLGRYEQGRKEVLIPKVNKGRYGLGYKPTHEDGLQAIGGRKSGHGARLGRVINEVVAKLPIPHISQSFVSSSTKMSGMVAIIEEEGMEEVSRFVYMCPPGTRLRNWKEEAHASVSLELK
ncbi:PREDICTED: uncharacterized protein LOC109327698 [Lupinus angustifolius]|uniref:uncharacterized protein LOC109327698 n=1 Tax=Lupinus angustifolius TaxID=3871 RepID=UPI00092E8CAB|nr:PREDICTED: uncharacterized protein LOC109327698 [Lupinus angustifolius]